MTETYDIIIIGGGIAGSSLAWQLAPRRRVLLLEREDVAGYHTTGRSAAFFAETYGGPLIQPLSSASRSFLARPDAGFSDVPLLNARGMIHVYSEDRASAAEALLSEMASVRGVAHFDQSCTLSHVSCLKPSCVAGAVYDPTCGDLDVAAIHQAYLKGAKASGAQILLNAAVETAFYDGVWVLRTRSGDVFQADMLVNAAGAWCDDVARRCGLSSLGLIPKRRTVLTADLDIPVDPDWPIVMDIDEKWYFRVEGDGVLITPADATPTVPSDVQPEELDIARAVARFEDVVNARVTRVKRRWAGLRTFAPDKAPVIGFDPSCSGFFWSAGQGGWGIQTAPAWSRLAASMILAGPDGQTDGQSAYDLSAYTPERLLS